MFDTVGNKHFVDFSRFLLWPSNEMGWTMKLTCTNS